MPFLLEIEKEGQAVSQGQGPVSQGHGPREGGRGEGKQNFADVEKNRTQN